VGLVLLTAAAFKGYQLATEPALENGVFTSRWFLMGLVEFELLLGIWLLSGWSQRWSGCAAIGAFAGFGCYALYNVLVGADSCG
jgi:hypothetical protein